MSFRLSHSSDISISWLQVALECTDVKAFCHCVISSHIRQSGNGAECSIFIWHSLTVWRHSQWWWEEEEKKMRKKYFHIPLTYMCVISLLRFTDINMITAGHHLDFLIIMAILLIFLLHSMSYQVHSHICMCMCMYRIPIMDKPLSSLSIPNPINFDKLKFFALSLSNNKKKMYIYRSLNKSNAIEWESERKK